MPTYTDINLTMTNDDTIDLGIAAPNDALTMLVTINGQEKTYYYSFTGIGNIIVDNVFQRKYAHKLVFYDSSDSLYLDTVYTVITNDVTALGGSVNNITEIEFTVSSEGTSSWQDDAMIGARHIIVFAKMGTTYQLMKQTGFDPVTGTASFGGDETIGSIDGQTILIKIFKDY
jgi:hypothetical protein